MIGAGYVGLVSGVCFAEFGHTVCCVDTDSAKIDKLNRGVVPIYEPGLADLIATNSAAGRLSFSTDFNTPVPAADAVFLAVGTPSRRGDGHADLSYVFSAARSVARLINGYTVIITKSTVPVGTGDEIERIIRECNPQAEVSIVSNPEFLREGAAISDFKRPDRVIVGTSDQRAISVMEEIYRPLSLNASPIYFTDRRSAELIKYASNAYLAMKITFINEIADLCEVVKANVQDVARGMGLDNRIGSKFLHAGPGYGGSCFPKDTTALVKIAHDNGCHIRLTETTLAVNDARKRAMGRKILNAMGGEARGKTIAILGLTFKPNTDDMREAPSIAIVTALQDAGANIRAFDPVGIANARELMDDVIFCDDPYDAAKGADAVVVVTEWDELRALDLVRLRQVVSHPTFIDLRNIYKPTELTRLGFKYAGVGRGPGEDPD